MKRLFCPHSLLKLVNKAASYTLAGFGSTYLPQSEIAPATLRPMKIKNVALKNFLFRIYDFLASPLTLLTAFQMRILRRYGVLHFPIAKRILLKFGVFPIRRHFYEPLFHGGDLTKKLEDPRSLPGIQFDPENQLKLLKAFDYNNEITALFGDQDCAQFGEHKSPINNNAFRHGDVELYYNIVRHFQPSKIIEIGSGYSTMIALLAVQETGKRTPGYHCSIIAIEPYPWFRHERLELISKLVEDIPLDTFAQLKANDILFIDSSHMIRPQGDVLCEILDILPRLAPGVIVHVHDVFTPRDYPEEWVVAENRFWNEQYLLEAFLSCNEQFKVLIAPNYLQLNHPAELLQKCPLLAKVPDARIHSFWIQRTLDQT
jgi:predicted O-methyltransferase YrrM